MRVHHLNNVNKALQVLEQNNVSNLNNGYSFFYMSLTMNRLAGETREHQ